MSNYFSRDLLLYLKQRLFAWPVCLLPCLISAAALVPYGPVALFPVVETFLLAVLLVFEFRLWDDLVDRQQDQQQHPERVLCQTTHVRIFQQLVVIVAVIVSAILAGLLRWEALSLLLLLHVVIASWYLWRGQLRWGPVTHYHVVLLKYPMFVWVLGNFANENRTAALLTSSAVVYLMLCAYEALHDRQLRSLRTARVMLALELALLPIAITIGLW